MLTNWGKWTIVWGLWLCWAMPAWAQSLRGQYEPDPEVDFPAYYDLMTTRLAKVRAKLELTPMDVALFQDRALLYRETLKGFKKAYKTDYQLYERYRVRMDSMRFRLVMSSVNWLSLAPQIAAKQGEEAGKATQMQALLHMGFAYALANDAEYMERVGLKLDTLGYEFPYFSHGPYIGAGLGSNLMVEVGYSLGYMHPTNKLVNQKPKWGGLLVGIAAVPTRGLVGVMLGGSGTVADHLHLGFHLGILGNTKYFDPDRQRTTNVADAYIVKPEIGYSYGTAQFYGAYNLIVGNKDLPDKYGNNVKNGWPVFMVGTRFVIPFRTGELDMPYKSGDLRDGLERP